MAAQPSVTVWAELTLEQLGPCTGVPLALTCVQNQELHFFLWMCLIRGFFPKLQVNVPLTMLSSVSVNAFIF